MGQEGQEVFLESQKVQEAQEGGLIACFGA